MKDFDRFLLSVVYDIPSFIFVVDPADTRVIYANHFMRATLGEAVLGRKFTEQFPGAGGSHYFVSYAQQDAGEAAPMPGIPEPQSEYYDDESENWYHIQQRRVEWIDGTDKVVCVMNEINALKRLQNELSEAHASLAFKNRELDTAAKTDRLTQLYNRHHIDAVIAQELQRYQRSGKPFSVFLVDCDFFKSVNDTHGHQVGDLVLIDIARLMRAGVRATDTVGRWGGEEFFAILPETSLAGAVEVAEKLRRLIEGHDFPRVGHKTASFGVAQLHASESVKELIARADAALYRAKERGRNRVEPSEPAG